MEHKLKTVNPHFQHVWEGVKTFEFRKNDRNYCVGDVLFLKEYFPETNEFSDRGIYVKVTHMLTHEDFADVPEDYVILSTKILYDRHHHFKRKNPVDYTGFFLLK